MKDGVVVHSCGMLPCFCKEFTVKKAPSHSNPAYVCKRIRQIFKDRGWPMFKMRGHYTPFFNRQTGTEGFQVRKVGCSKSVAIHYSAGYGDGRSKDVTPELKRRREAEASELLLSLGYRVDERGWIECDRKDEWD